MDRLLLDACVVINLAAGGILRSLAQEAGADLFAVEQVTAEVLYIDDDENEREELDWSALAADGIVRPLALDGGEELTTFLGLVPRLGDGEAASVAAARHRGLVLATDDVLALTTAASGEPVVETVTTPDVVSWWADAVAADEQRVAVTIRCIEARARYRPPVAHALAPWWMGTALPSEH